MLDLYSFNGRSFSESDTENSLSQSDKEIKDWEVYLIKSGKGTLEIHQAVKKQFIDWRTKNKFNCPIKTENLKLNLTKLGIYSTHPNERKS